MAPGPASGLTNTAYLRARLGKFGADSAGPGDPGAFQSRVSCAWALASNLTTSRSRKRFRYGVRTRVGFNEHRLLACAAR